MEDYYYDLEVKPIFENHGIQFRGPCALYRMNLLAASDRDKTTMFVAVGDTIYVYQLSLLNDKPGEPSKILKHPVDSELPQKDHSINAIKVGMIGNEEVLVSVDDAGCILIWFTANLDKNPIQFSNDESTWGIALHGPKRLLAVSANSHEITIFNLQKSVQFFSEFDDDVLDSSDEEEPQTPKTYASVLTKISDNDALGGKAVSVLRGHEHNIPNVSFSPCGRYLISSSIDSTCRMWNVKTGELIKTKLLTVDIGDFHDPNDSEDWGWTANFVSKSAFKTVSANCEVGRNLISNSASIPSSPRSDGTLDSLNHQHLRHDLDAYRIIINGYRSRDYEDGYVEDDAYLENDYSSEEESNEDDLESESNDDDTEEESDNREIFIIEDDEISFHPSRQPPNHERSVTEIGNATPAYYDRAESATPVVENYTENNPDYRWSVGHELSILSNNDEQNGAPSIPERELEDHNEERPEDIVEEIPTQNNTYTLHSPKSIVSSSQTISEDITPASSHSNPNFSSETSVSPTYSRVSPEYVPANQESSPSHSSTIDSTINGLQQELLLPNSNIISDSLSNRHEIESISQPSSMNIVDIPVEEEYLNTATRDDETIHPPTHPLPSSLRGGTIIDSPSRNPDVSNGYRIYDEHMVPHYSSWLGCRPDLGLADELVLYTSKHNLFILDPKSNLKILRTEKDIVRKIDLRRFLNYSCDRLNMIEVIPELSLAIVASQRGKVALTRLIKIDNDSGKENYYLYPEKHLPQTLPFSPLLGMFVTKHNTLQDPALFYYRLYLMYYSGTMFCYEIRRGKETNPLRMDNVLI